MLSSSSKLNSAEPQISSESVSGPNTLDVADITDRVPLSVTSASRSEKQESMDEPSNVATAPLPSALISQSSRLSYSTGAGDYDEIQEIPVETKPSTPLEQKPGTTNSPTMSGGLFQRPSARKNSVNSIDLERGSAIGNDRSSASPRNTIRESGDSSPRSSDAKGLVFVVESSNQINRQSDPVSLPSFSEPGKSGQPLTTEPDLPVDEDLFHAFSETRWFRSVPFAMVGFSVMTLMVLGNLVYTYYLLNGLFVD